MMSVLTFSSRNFKKNPCLKANHAEFLWLIIGICNLLIN